MYIFGMYTQVFMLTGINICDEYVIGNMSPTTVSSHNHPVLRCCVGFIHKLPVITFTVYFSLIFLTDHKH